MEKWKRNQKRIIEILTCPYEDEKLSFWIKGVYGAIWFASFPIGYYLHAPTSHYVALFVMVLSLFCNYLWCHRKYNPWVDTITFIPVGMATFFVFDYGTVGYFSMMYPLIYCCGIVFILGIRVSMVYHGICLVILVCYFGFTSGIRSHYVYDAEVAFRYPYLMICFVGICYIVMYSIQSYWVEKKHRKEMLEERIREEKYYLFETSQRVLRTMQSAMTAKRGDGDGHFVAVARDMERLAKRTNKSRIFWQNAYYAGLLHEIGTIGVSDEILNKDPLTEAEFEEYKTYVQRGYDILHQLQMVDEVAEAVRDHRERYDGTGYPQGKKGEKIPELARMLSVVDYANRHLQRGETYAQVIEEIKSRKGKRFEPTIAEEMIQLLREKEYCERKI